MCSLGEKINERILNTFVNPFFVAFEIRFGTVPLRGKTVDRNVLIENNVVSYAIEKAYYLPFQ